MSRSRFYCPLKRGEGRVVFLAAAAGFYCFRHFLDRDGKVESLEAPHAPHPFFFLFLLKGPTHAGMEFVSFGLNGIVIK
jgi:hypothetical protein